MVLPVVKLCGKLHVQIQIKIVREPFQQPRIHPVCKDLDYWHKEIIQNSIKYNISNTLARYDKRLTNRSCSQCNMRNKAKRTTEVVNMSYCVYSSTSMISPPARSNIRVNFTTAS